MARTLALATVCLLAAGLSITAAQGLFGAPPANVPADNAAPATPPAAENEPAAPVRPGSPTAVVKPFYEHVGLELDPAERSDFADPAKSVLDKSDALRKSGQGECLDPNMALDNAAYDRAEIDKSLKTVEAVKGDEAKVIVAFIIAGNPHRLEWKLRKVGDGWKITDLLSVTGEWALSQYQCE
ncbi:MAG: hypothetical protein EOQ86_15420 [Mesorhizobium sp.]|uniref:hypothetical protein n=1 Tax=Mesorhizobium sp. TaxID=1871066 RepID=UPI000FE5AD92|nr:hypothetical protein [Mesorhizobium sp.]RWH79273.1 MAG: hypothetical protein EOQ85_13770 [Mesorhizobium sp.]RWH81801.1 MAG: hypothetical protein EOQ86_15420 [Mesorhizobium sp.]RWH88067.1 MAG: hypothetical protein EOQ87_23620 [Mesorhizobium sp.]RWI01609.1 MAG: hypothetical protein EOQ88_04110 [Mesorhizobium sp.]RWI02056.1 MAG: hypothetical protein EOQ89_15315 [Mesorhizobium sp.]